MARSRWLFVAFLAVDCGGSNGAATGSGAKTGPPSEGSDPAFSAYAATHGVISMDSPANAPEVVADGLRLEALGRDKSIKLDGVLSQNEWPAPTRATRVTRGPAKATLKVALQYDDTKLYVGAEVGDTSLDPGKDHMSLVLAIPKPGGRGAYASYDLRFFAGKPGESEGSVRYTGQARVPGAKLVEAPTEGGYTFEAIVPLVAIPEMRATRVGIRGFAAYMDGDAVISTGPGDAQHPAAMAWVPSEPELSMIEQLLAPKGLTTIAPAAEIVADLTGDGIRERIAVFEHFLTICGSSYLGGTGFFYRDLIGELVKLEVRDVSGRGKGDVVVWRRQSSGDGSREYLEVLSALANDQEPRLTFAHEIGVRQSDRHIANAVHLSPGTIEVSTEAPTGWNEASYGEPIATDVEPILLPWGGARSQVFRFDGERFVKAKELRQEAVLPRSGRAATRSDGASSAGRGAEDKPHAVIMHPTEPPTSQVTRGGELSAQVLEQYRRDRGVSARTAPKVDLQVQVVGDSRPERVLLIGRDIVVLGPGVKDGTGYVFIVMQQFADASDVKDLSTRDLTGDGAPALVVRGVRHLVADGGDVEVELLFVYRVKDDAIARVFGIETARERKGKRVQGLVQFIPTPDGRAFDILSAPGRATGWTSSTYPWAQGQPGAGNLEPILLPWGGIPRVRYSWNGEQFVRNEL